MNLIINASQAIGDQGGMIEVEIDSLEVSPKNKEEFEGLPRGMYAQLRVNDTGCGIDSEIQERIFEPFFTTKMIGQASGMGLSVCYGIVADLGGKIIVKSAVGKGTESRVLIPRFLAAGKQSAMPVLESAPRGSGHILFVDDERAIVGIVKEMLEGLGYVVTPAASGLQAYQLFEASPHKFDLVMTDLNMPEMDGVQLAQRVHAIRPDLPIILTTGFARDLSAQQIKEMGFEALLWKPYSQATLGKTIAEIVAPAKLKSGR